MNDSTFVHQMDAPLFHSSFLDMQVKLTFISSFYWQQGNQSPSCKKWDFTDITVYKIEYRQIPENTKPQFTYQGLLGFGSVHSPNWTLMVELAAWEKNRRMNLASISV